MSLRELTSLYQAYRAALAAAQRRGRTPEEVHLYIDLALLWTRAKKGLNRYEIGAVVAANSGR
jgi:hypothetical protein